MSFSCPYGLRRASMMAIGCLKMALILVAALLPGTMMLAQTTTTLVVAPSAGPLAPHTVVTLTATVVAGSTPVNPGLVTFCDATAPHCSGVAVVGTAQLTPAGTAVLRFVPGSGIHSYHAVFAGTTTHTTSTSPAEAVTVSSPTTFPTTSSITSSGSPGNYTLTATVVGTGTATLVPGGSVGFVDTTNGNSSLGTAPLGSATLGRGFVNAAGSPVAVGSSPLFVASGDFNGDGFTDLVVVNSDTDSVSIFIGDGIGGFAPTLQSPIAVGDTPFGVAVGDFNGDGHPDIAVANSNSNNVSILLGDGHGGFSQGSPISVGRDGSLPYGVAVGDFNGDGNTDLAVADQGANTVIILLGNGSGGFTESSSSPVAVGEAPYSVSVGDFNSDGHADLAVVNTVSNNVTILLGNGSGAFTPESPVAVGGSPRFAGIGDFNGDGIPDLAVSNSGPDNLSILIGDGHGGFSPTSQSPISVGNSPRVVVVSDFNGDGHVDLAVANFVADNVSILLGDGHGDFSQAAGSPVIVGSGPRGMVVGDFNGDGMPDLAVANNGATTVNVLLNQVTQTATATLNGVRIIGTGEHHAHATYPGDTNFIGSTSPNIPLMATQVATTTTLVLSTADTIAIGTPVTLTANVTPHTEGGFTATGSVSFHDGTTELGTAPILSTGHASIVVSNFALGAHTLTAVYVGDTHFTTSTSTQVHLTVNPAPISVALVSSLNPSDPGQTVTFTATVPVAAIGTIQFRNGSANLGTPVTIATGVAAFSISTLTPGMHAITAAYSGDTNHLPATSDVLTQQVTALSTTTTLTASPTTSPLPPQTPLTLTATVMASGTAVHPGRVTFCNATAPHCSGPALLGTAQLTPAGTAVLRFIPGSGSHSYIAVFGGTTTYATSSSPAQAVTVASPTTFPTTTTITSNGSPGAYSLTATVVGTGSSTLPPTGGASFTDTTNGNVLGPAMLGEATLAQGFVNATGSPFTVGAQPDGVAVGDFNGDGIPDLAVANTGAASITILLGTIGGGFSTVGPPQAVGSFPISIAVGDFNGDGIADLAVANEHDNDVSILIGHGDGTFTSGATIATGAAPIFVAVEDFNGDGIADLAVANFGSNNVSILLGNGDGTFTLGTPVAVGTSPFAIAVGDFNGNGHADLAVANQGSNNISVLLGNGDGTFTPGTPVAAAGPVFVVAGDFDGNGITDLAAVTNNTVTILLGNGSGGFTATGSPIAVGTAPITMAIGDFNGDSITDLAVSNFGSNNVSILLGNGTGGFAAAPGSPVTVGGQPYGVAVGDFNGDGLSDLTVANSGANTVSVLLKQITQTATAMLTGVSVPGSGAVHAVNATYGGDANFDTSISPTIPLTSTPVVTATTLVLSAASPISFGTEVILTATVAPHMAGSNLTTTGTVTFDDGTTLLGSSAISAAGEASITVSTFAVGVHPLTATYSGDTNFSGSLNVEVPLTVNPAPIEVSLASSDNPSNHGQQVTFTASVPFAATGTIQFMNGTANLSTPVTIAAGVAAFATNSLTVGSHPITAVYSGDASHLAATSGVLTQEVSSLATSTALTVSPSSSPDSPLSPQTVVTLTAVVTSGGTAVSPGLVRFCDATAPHCAGLAVVGTAQLTNTGTAVLRFTPGSGSHSYIAVFAGTRTNISSTSTSQAAVTVSSPTTFPSTTNITSSGSAGDYTLTATVVGTGNATLGPTGSVSFIDTTNSNTLLGTATLGDATLGQSFANALASPFAVGNHPVAVAVGDFNGDGIADVVVANETDNTVSILLGTGNGGFTPAGSPVAVGAAPFGVSVGDFNGDGHADLAVANTGSNTVSILLGNGDGTFTQGSPVAVGTTPYLVAVGDFNGDGIADLAVTNFSSNNVSILLGSGDGTFAQAPGSPVAAGTHPYAVAAGDFNGDGIADLAVTNQATSNVSILLGHGDGTFVQAPGSPVAAGSFPGPVAVQDFNRDGHADLAVVNITSDNLSILLGNGDGTFAQAPGSPIAVDIQPNDVVAGDFNGDGIVDLAVPNFESNTVTILLGNGTGGFPQDTASSVAVGDGPYAVAIGDFNGDGIADLAVPNYFSHDLSVLLNQVTQTATAVLPGVSIPGSGATHNVNATYLGDTNFVGSTSPTIPLIASQVTTSTSLELSSAGTIAFGTPVTLTANVTPYTISGLLATGTVNFLDGTTSLGTAPISTTGVASITESTFALGVHSLIAVYTGDTNFLTSMSAPVSLTVNPAPIAVSLASSHNPSLYGQTVIFTATVPSGATGTIQFRDSAANLGGPITIAGGVAAFLVSTLAAGTHAITAAYSGDMNHTPATSDVLIQLVTPEILTVTANNSTRTFNQPNATLGYTITGFVGSDTQANSVGGTPTLSTTATQTSSVGIYPITVGLGSLSAPNYTFAFMNGVLAVTKATPGVGGALAVDLASSINPSSRGQSVTFTATLPAHATGQVTFMDGGVALGTAPVLNEAASISTSQLAVATHPIMAMYGGDTNHTAASSAVLSQVVNNTTLQVIANDAQRIFGQPNPAFETTITGFIEGDSQDVVRGTPIVTTTATPTSPAGIYPIVAMQGTLTATNYILAFVNGRLNVMPAIPGVGPTPPVMTTPSLNPAPLGSPVILTATVPTGATGTVSFLDGTTLLGTAPVVGNTATLTISTLAPGTHSITSVYSGDANFAMASSAPFSLVVLATAVEFTLTSSTGALIIPPGASASFTIAVSSTNGAFTNPVTMSASGLPPGATYTFTPPAITPGTAGASTAFVVSVPMQSNMASRGRHLGPAAFALLLLPFACLKRYRRPQRLLLWMLVALTSFGAVSGCGGGGYFSQPQQTYTITVTGTSGSLVHSTTVTLTVE